MNGKSLCCAIAAVACFVGAAHATTCQDLCGSSSGDCHVSTTRTVSPESVIDCSGRDVFVEGPNGKILVANGVMKLTAKSLTVEPGRFIEASQTSAGSFGVELTIAEEIQLDGYLKADGGFGGGSIVATAGDDIVVSNSGMLGVSANSTGSNAPAGSVKLVSGGDVSIQDKIEARYNPTGGDASGGTIVVEAEGDILVGQQVSTWGRNARGGRVMLEANGALDVQARIEAESGGTEGDGGHIRLSGYSVVVGDALSARSGVGHNGGLGEGGTVEILGGSGGIQILDGIEAYGGEMGPGMGEAAVLARSAAGLVVSPGVAIRTSATVNGGAGGDVLLEAAGNVTIGDAVTIDASGDLAANGDGEGGHVFVDGCTVSVPASATIESGGLEGGTIEIVGRTLLSVGATLDVSGTEAGEIELFYRDAVSLTANAGALTAVQDTGLGGCGA